MMHPWIYCYQQRTDEISDEYHDQWLYENDNLAHQSEKQLNEIFQENNHKQHAYFLQSSDEIHSPEDNFHCYEEMPSYPSTTLNQEN